MNFEQMPKFQETEAAAEKESFENIGEANAIARSLFALALLLGGCEKIIEAESNTEVITVHESIPKQFEAGYAQFQMCSPVISKEAGKDVERHISTLFVEDTAPIQDPQKPPHFFGARFIRTEIDNQGGSIAVTFFEDNATIRENPCTEHRLLNDLNGEKKSSYELLIAGLNLRLNVLRALKTQAPPESNEISAARIEAERTLQSLRKEFGPHAYNKKIVEDILN